MPPLPLAHLGLDESGFLPDDTPWFTLAGVLTYQPDAERNLVRRVATHSGKRLKRPRHAVSEFKWNNTSRRFRDAVLSRLAQADVEIYALTVNKGGRRVADTPENIALLVCELLLSCRVAHPNLALSLDRRFTSPAHIAIVNTFVYRHWPTPGVLSISHVDSQRSPLVQLADFVAGSFRAWHKEGDEAVNAIRSRVRGAAVEDWPDIWRRWS